MSNSAAAIAEMPVTSPPDGGRRGRGREGKNARRAARAKPAAIERYFLSADSAGEKIALGLELPTEQEALVAAFQEKGTFFVVTEYRVETQFKGANALLVKEGISRTDR